jgi:hypothetical protein
MYDTETTLSLRGKQIFAIGTLNDAVKKRPNLTFGKLNHFLLKQFSMELYYNEKNVDIMLKDSRV